VGHEKVARLAFCTCPCDILSGVSMYTSETDCQLRSHHYKRRIKNNSLWRVPTTQILQVRNFEPLREICLELPSGAECSYNIHDTPCTLRCTDGSALPCRLFLGSNCFLRLHIHVSTASDDGEGLLLFSIWTQWRLRRHVISVVFITCCGTERIRKWRCTLSLKRRNFTVWRHTWRINWVNCAV
jgi:hypothetical protein